MTEMCASRRAEETKEEKHDLFSSLLDASDDEGDGGARLTDRELLGKPCDNLISAVSTHSTLIISEQVTYLSSYSLATR